VDGGTGAILVDGNDGAINLAGALTTTNATATAVRIIDATTAALGNITTGGAGTVVLGGAGVDNLSGAVTQTGIVTTGTLTGNAGSTVVLGGANVLTNLGAFAANGLTVNDATLGLTVTGAVSGGTGATSITTTGGALAIGANPISGTGVTLTANDGTSGDITSAAGGTINGGTGAVQLTAGRNVTLNAAVSAGTTVTIDFGQTSTTGGAFQTTSSIAGAPATVNGGVNNDTFTVGSALTANLAGNGGDDTFNINAALTGSVSGGLGSDTLAGSRIVDVTLTTASDANGYNGALATAANLLGGFSGINVLNGTGTLTGRNAASTWTLGGATGTYSDGGATTLTFSIPFGTLQGGTSTDAFTVTAASTANVLGGAGNDSFTINAPLTGSVNGEANTDTLAGSANSAYTISNVVANSGTATGITGGWSNIENLTGTGTSTLQATGATWDINTPNGGTVTNLAGTFAGMANLADLGTGTFNMNAGNLSGSLGGGTNGVLSYAGRTGPVFFDVSNRTGLTTGVGTTYSGITSVTGSAASDTIRGNLLPWTLNGADSGSANGISWTSFENVNNSLAGATFTLTGGSLTQITSTGATTFFSDTNVSVIVNIGGTLALTGAATQWVLSATSSVNGSTVSPGGINPNGLSTLPDIYFNGPAINGPTGGIVGGVVGSIGGSIAEISARALDEAFDTDSVAKQIKDGFAGDVGTTPPMDHRIDDTGISVPKCFEQSREGEGEC
jgi:hypothetical protein